MFLDLETHVTTEERIEWVGEFAMTLMSLGVIYIFVRINEDPSHHPAIAIPLVWRLMLLAALAVSITTARVWLSNRMKRRRQRTK